MISKKYNEQMGNYLAKLAKASKPQTNADRIRQMSDEDLARWVAGYVLNLTGGSFDLSEQSWLNWLKSPVEVDK